MTKNSDYEDYRFNQNNEIMTRNIRIASLLILLISFSCVKDVDFDQSAGFTITPVYNSAFTYFTATPASFFDSTGTVQQDSITDVGQIDFFQNQYVEESLVQLDFLVEASNQFSRDISIAIQFQDSSGLPLYTLTPIVVLANQNDYSYTEVIDLRINQQVFNTTRVLITASVQDTGVPLNPTDTSEFKFESALVFYIERSF